MVVSGRTSARTLDLCGRVLVLALGFGLGLGGCVATDADGVVDLGSFRAAGKADEVVTMMLPFHVPRAHGSDEPAHVLYRLWTDGSLAVTTAQDPTRAGSDSSWSR
jgi:hypothetical protein